MNIEKIKKANTRYVGKHVIYYEEIDSTQDEAKKLIQNKLENGSIIITDKQTKGRGTKGRTWYTNQGKNITMTIAIFPDCKIEKLEGLTVRIAKSMVNTIKELYNIKLEIKSPNDLLLNNKKIGGILTESSTYQDKVSYILIGIGFNVNETEFSEEVENIATSLKKKFNKEFVIEDIICKFIENLENNIY